jgi:hypothetical protein
LKSHTCAVGRTILVGAGQSVAGVTTAATATAATTATTIPTATTTAITTTAATLGTLLRFVDLDRASIEHEPVELSNRAVRSLLVTHRYECKTAGQPGFTIRRHSDFANIASDRKCVLDGSLRGVERQISDVKTITHDAFGASILRFSRTYT